MTPFFSLIVPCYNEAEHISGSLLKVIDVLIKLEEEFEIIIIDDSSKDNTVEIIEAFIKKQKNNPIKFIKHEKNIGRGGTVNKGIKLAKGEIVGFIDIDLEVSPKYIPQFIDAIRNKEADVVVGRRSYSFSLRNLHRFLASSLYSLIIQMILHLPIHDTEAGYKFFKKLEILPVIKHVKDVGWFWDTEIIALSHIKGLKIKEINVLFRKRNDKTSTVRLLNDTFLYIKSLISFKNRMKHT